MAGPFSIQRIPRGLLSLLGMKGTGRNPAELTDHVAATMGLLPFYTSDLLEGISADAAAAAANGTSASVTVPTGETWYVLGVGGGYLSLATATVGDVIESRLSLTSGTGQPGFTFGQFGPYTIPAVSATPRFGLLFPQPLILQSGSILNHTLTRTLGGAGSFTLRFEATIARFVT